MLVASGWVAAVLMGVTLGLIGGGGSILTVPILVYLFGVEPVRATGYSLFVVAMTALVGATRYVRAGFVDARATVLFGFPSLAGVYAVRRWVVPALPDPLWGRGDLVVTKDLFVMVVFAIVMAVAGGSMILSKRAEPDPAEPRTRRAVPLAMLDGVVVGCVTGFVGAGKPRGRNGPFSASSRCSRRVVSWPVRSSITGCRRPGSNPRSAGSCSPWPP